MAIFIITGKPGHGKTAYMAKLARQFLLDGERIFSNIKFYPKEMFKPLPHERFLFWKKTKYKDFEAIEGQITNPIDRENCNILYWTNFSDWQYFKDGIVFCQEGLKYFNARKWETLPDSMQDKFVEHRKDRVDLYFDVQHFSFIEKTLRMLCRAFYNLELKFGSAEFEKDWRPRISKVVEADLITLNKCESLNIDPYNCHKDEANKYFIDVVTLNHFWIRPYIFNWYDSDVKVAKSYPEPRMKLCSRHDPGFICPMCEQENQLVTDKKRSSEAFMPDNSENNNLKKSDNYFQSLKT